MKFRDIEMHIIPSLHQHYAISGDRKIPVKPLPSDAKTKPISPDSSIHLYRSSSQDPKSADRIAIKDLFSKKRFSLPSSITIEEVELIETIATGHEMLPFMTPVRCMAEHYSTILEEN